MSIEELHERAVDQLVDEALARHHALRHLLASEQLPMWAGADVRIAAAHAIARLTTGPERDRSARAIVTNLWCTDDGARIPAPWWATPLGRLLLDRMRTDPAQQAATHNSNVDDVARRRAVSCDERDCPVRGLMPSPSPTSSARRSEHRTPGAPR